MRYRVYVDGQEGTTGLKIHQYLAGRDDLEVLKIDSAKRKDPEIRRAFLNEADLVFLCLPDQVARESVSLITSRHTKIIDASNAFRTAPDWVYGIPELYPGQRERIQNSTRVSVAGCHATGFVLPIYPLIQSKIIPNDYPITVHSITGYSGGGKPLIKYYEDPNNRNKVKAPHHYALQLNHKHLAEMKQVTGLLYEPLFMPVVADYYQGMAVSIPLLRRALRKPYSPYEIHQLFSDYFHDEPFVKVMPFKAESNLEQGFFDPCACNLTNRLELFVFGNDEQSLIMTRLDNLGKGASGAAMQNMNLMLGMDETVGFMEEYSVSY